MRVCGFVSLHALSCDHFRRSERLSVKAQHFPTVMMLTFSPIRLFLGSEIQSGIIQHPLYSVLIPAKKRSQVAKSLEENQREKDNLTPVFSVSMSKCQRGSDKPLLLRIFEEPHWNTLSFGSEQESPMEALINTI